MELKFLKPLVEISPTQYDYQTTQLRLQKVLMDTGRLYLDKNLGLKRFSTLTPAQQQVSLKEINSWCEVVEEYLSIGGQPAKTKDLSRYYFAKLGFHIDRSFLETIQDGDIVEVYGMDLKRLFFNPELFDYSSYAPDEMFTSSMWELYRRDVKITESVGAFAHQLLSGAVSIPTDPLIPKHIVSEIASERRYSSEVDIKLCTPVYLGRARVGFAVRERFRLVLS